MRRWGLILLLVFTLSLVFSSIALGQRREVEVNGLILDQTQTRIGQQFYENFVMFWESPSEIEDYNILVTEMASPIWGSWVRIEVNTVMVYEDLLKPRSENVEESAKKAVESVREYLYRLYEKEASEDMEVY